jgi:hypothetical protein
MSYDGFPAPFPAAAEAAGIAIGCVGVTYRIDTQGRATDAQLVSDYPPGYGFGERGLTVLNHLKFAPGVTDPNLHFFRLITRLRPNPAGSWPVPSSPPPTRPWGLVT